MTMLSLMMLLLIVLTMASCDDEYVDNDDRDDGPDAVDDKCC